MKKATQTGKDAEAAVSRRLEGEGYKILDRNWRTNVCEIDLVAKKGGIVYFIEAKYRASDEQGGGLDYITPKKLAQMEFAAGVWCSVNRWEGDCRLLAAAVDGVQFDKVQIIEV